MSKSNKLIEIMDFLTKYKIKNATINDDFTVDVDGRVEIHDKNLKEIPIQFGKVSRDFDCDGCSPLTSLQGVPKEVGGYFYCNNCDSLTSLEGAPKKVGENFDCNNCSKLTSLQGAPEHVGGSFYCSYCPNLTSLQGAPEYVGGSFYCSYCHNIKTLYGIKEVKGEVYSDFFRGYLKNYKGEL